MKEPFSRDDTPCVAADASLLAGQVAYYRARAVEYDAWWYRTGRFDRGAENNGAWRADVAVVESAVVATLAAARPTSVLELACGTGLFTRHLAPHADRVTAVDAAPEVIAINRERVASRNVEYVEADLFAWQPPARYDCVFMASRAIGCAIAISRRHWPVRGSSPWRRTCRVPSIRSATAMRSRASLPTSSAAHSASRPRRARASC